jgi:hypothetical protein
VCSLGNNWVKRHIYVEHLCKKSPLVFSTLARSRAKRTSCSALESTPEGHRVLQGREGL